MAQVQHLSSTAHALFRVFIQSAFAATRHVRPSVSAPAAFVHPQRRTAINYRSAAERKTAYDEEIGSRLINLVDEEGVFRPGTRLDHALADIDRSSHHVVLLAPPQPGSEQPYPVCKIVSKQTLREQERARAKHMNRKSVEELTKTLELNWAASPNDLKHWLKRLREFLEDGKRVEVILGPRRRGRKASSEEIQDVLQSIRDTQAGVRGAKERADPEGEPGAIMTLFFEGSKQVKEEQTQVKEKREENLPAEQKAPKPSRWRIKQEERKRQTEVQKIKQESLERADWSRGSRRWSAPTHRTDEFRGMFYGR